MIRVNKLPYKLFLESFKYAPRPAVNLLIERDMEVSQTSNQNVKFAKLNKLISKAVLLTKRKKPPFAGYWHLPGSFVLKRESLMDCVNRVAKEELGVKVESVEFSGAFDDLVGDPRGHVVDLVYRCEIKKGYSLPPGKEYPYQKIKPIGDSAEIRFFKKLPSRIGFNHRETLAALGYH